MGEGRPFPPQRSWGETPPEADGEAAGPRPVSPPAQESHSVRLTHRKDGGQTRKGLRQVHKTPHPVDQWIRSLPNVFNIHRFQKLHRKLLTV